MEIIQEKLLEQKVVSYWTERAPSFGQIRHTELHNDIGERWGSAIRELLLEDGPCDLRGLRVLDVGTGAGMFAILMAKMGCEVIGIDLTPAMIEEAREQALREGCDISFLIMDAQEPAFDDESFDVIITRNLTWTLPDAETAYRNWFRLLKAGGRLFNFDANYGAALIARRDAGEERRHTYGHNGVTREMAAENEHITLSMDISRKERPAWDLEVMKAAGFRDCSADPDAGRKVMGGLEDVSAPMFLVKGKK